MTYTELAVAAAAAAALVDLTVLRTRLLCRRLFWTAYAIVLAFQLVTNGVLTARHVVSYDPGTILGPRLAYAPVEDLLFGFAMVTLTLSTWVRLGYPRGCRNRATRARARPGTATASRRPSPTDTRRSSTR